ncbi:unnamed protein product [Paramecium sonneborni]|uniref:Uncharacterized protein n=1 Tax=Paramecium sonneborni TaxID=65129 RepID=A0A8S1RUJ4_9CILI|nr:unnamed protein product [Paramecium sonneborni]
MLVKHKFLQKFNNFHKKHNVVHQSYQQSNRFDMCCSKKPILKETLRCMAIWTWSGYQLDRSNLNILINGSSKNCKILSLTSHMNQPNRKCLLKLCYQDDEENLVRFI